ncbi:MAG: PD-(D/E)XK nuclease family protein [Candidatus Riflebacteria bacterium]|nr:PD-(D/E)XK nuclease family protein [Candidatus Riflebacteria bacterium]
MERIFLGWDRPFLHSLIDFLFEKYSDKNQWDLSEVSIFFASSRSARRLRELLAERAESERLLMLLPRFYTMGELPELFYEAEKAIAGKIVSILARMQSLEDTPPEIVSAVFPEYSSESSTQQRMSISTFLNNLATEISSGLISFEVACEKLSEKIPAFPDENRWKALHLLQCKYLEILEKNGFYDLNDARMQILECKRKIKTLSGQFYLACLPELSYMQKRFIKLSEDSFIPLVFAPEEYKNYFDDMGSIFPEKWAAETIQIDPENLSIVENSARQAHEILSLLSGMTSSNLLKDITADRITISLGDEKNGPLMEKYLELAGLPVHPASGIPLCQTSPALLIMTIAEYVSKYDYKSLATLIRHPALEYSLKCTDNPVEMLDKFIVSHIPDEINFEDPFLKTDDGLKIKDLVLQVNGLVYIDKYMKMPINSWAPKIWKILGRLFFPDGTIISQLNVSYETFSEMKKALEHFWKTKNSASFIPEITFYEALSLLIRLMSEQASPVATETSGIEMLGWLETPLDDAPLLFITSFNEGMIPQNIDFDPFLTDGVRSILGLSNNTFRYARDKANFKSILSSRTVRLLAARTGLRGESLAPSRIILSVQDNMLPEVIQKFYPKEKIVQGGDLWKPLKTSETISFLVPFPGNHIDPNTGKIQGKNDDTYNVTEFRDYLNCPYRYYLKHILKLKLVNDRINEMDAMIYGNFLHKILENFSASKVIRSTDSSEIFNFLKNEAEVLFISNFGNEASVILNAQLDTTLKRLEFFASVQSELAAGDWVIRNDFSEAPGEAFLEVDGKKARICGRIDRIDEHPKEGFRLYDYKTFDECRTPNEKHLQSREFVDLQLPLYKLLAENNGINRNIGLGYFCIPGKFDENPIKMAKWSDEFLSNAYEKAKEVIRNIRNGVFWPPRSEILDDEFSDLSLEKCLDWSNRRKMAETGGSK